jgi:hypothetical protein
MIDREKIEIDVFTAHHMLKKRYERDVKIEQIIKENLRLGREIRKEKEK